MHSARDVSERTVGEAVPDPPAADVRFTVLGPLELLRDGFDVAPSTPKVLQLLALLVMHPNRVVQVDTMVQELWENAPPKTVRTTLHTYIYHLRRCIEENELAPSGAVTVLERKPPGYVLRIDPGQVDVFEFHQLQREARELQAQGRNTEAAQTYRTALALWSGPPLSNVPCGSILTASRVELLEQRRSALHQRIEADIASGRHHELIGELRSLTTRNPLDEALHGQLMLALGRSGRRSDALRVYRDFRSQLAGELGVEPADELQTLHQNLLTEGEARLRPGGPHPGRPAAAPTGEMRHDA
ncbi:BTAD domain-containing putative transcriptional regulator [Amycolatopsis sp. NPDC098790]|uniref:AfsR/SARP family transcriptional regulator n=1 Tax=Amycolatopsis sp. NPDC098790 TaxID=3363939 RepID=UPI0038300D11